MDVFVIVTVINGRKHYLCSLSKNWAGKFVAAWTPNVAMAKTYDIESDSNTEITKIHNPHNRAMMTEPVQWCPEWENRPTIIDGSDIY